MSTHQPEQGPPQDAALSRLLRHWEVPSALPPAFARKVWRRLERTAQPTAHPVRPGPWTKFMILLRQPRTVAACLAVVVGIGAGAGVLKGQAQAEHLSDALQGRYVQSIDPFSHGVR
jgi:hypothetical protein